MAQQENIKMTAIDEEKNIVYVYVDNIGSIDEITTLDDSAVEYRDREQQLKLQFSATDVVKKPGSRADSLCLWFSFR
ncbi:hypothetical protein ['Paenibacillus yunnanensis' Narsing Rao et al. 2020]|uniref:hypothetical protein n=1 Tax=Paenibacillus tengchongensis TaxID=2608684 RepID=UPI00165291D3|nr:hypothetical protein [Paenibacillus tengchongensis]